MPDSAVAVTRVFLVGCPRSGTTLLQSLLAAHPRVLSFPESHFFTEGFGGSRIDRLKKYLAGGRHLQRVFSRWLDQLADKGIRPTRSAQPHWRRQAVIDQFTDQLDAWTRDAGKDVWVEKTPMHLDHIHQIAPAVPDARFVHIVRDGRAVVESLYRVTRQFPERWGGPRSLDACIAQWNRCLHLTLRYRGDPAHHIVCYTELIRDPQAALRPICDFLGIDWQPSMLQGAAETATNLIQADEDWKAGNLQDGIVSHGLERFRQAFDADQQRVINDALDLDAYAGLCPSAEPQT
jgi:LPS sulfotransferase NodH